MPPPDDAPQFQPPERVRTPRLMLRMPVPDDARALFEAYTADVEVVRYLTWRPHTALADTVAFLRKQADEWRDGRSFAFVISDREGREPAFGMIHLRLQRHAVSFGYVLRRSHWGRGFASEALSALVGWPLSTPAIHRAWASCDVDNPGSARVMEKAGMRYEGTLRRFVVHPNVSDEPRDAMVYARTRD